MLQILQNIHEDSSPYVMEIMGLSYASPWHLQGQDVRCETLIYVNFQMHKTRKKGYLSKCK